MINITITGKDVKATEAIKDYVEKKMERIERYFDSDIDVAVTIKAEKTEQIERILGKKRKSHSYNEFNQRKI